MTKNLIFQDFQGPGKHTDQFPKLSKTRTNPDRAILAHLTQA